MSDSEILWAVIIGAIAIGVSIIGFFLKAAWSNATENATEVANIKLELGKQRGKIDLLEQKLENQLQKHSTVHDLKITGLKETMDKLVRTVEHLDGNIKAQGQLYMELLKDFKKE